MGVGKRVLRKGVAPDVWAMLGLYAALLALFCAPGIVTGDAPVSALRMMCASEPRMYGNFPMITGVAREMCVYPLLTALGAALTLLFRGGPGKYAFGASIAALLFGMIEAYHQRYLPTAGGFAIPAALVLCAALLALCVAFAIVRRR